MSQSTLLGIRLERHERKNLSIGKRLSNPQSGDVWLLEISCFLVHILQDGLNLKIPHRRT